MARALNREFNQANPHAALESVAAHGKLRKQKQSLEHLILHNTSNVSALSFFLSLLITSAWAVDREFFDIYLPLWLPGGVFWTPLASPGPTLGSILALLAALGMPLDRFGLPLGCPWAPFGSLWGARKPQ